MCHPIHPRIPRPRPAVSSNRPPVTGHPCGLNRREFLGCVSGAVALGGIGLWAAAPAHAASLAPVAGTPLPPGKPLRIKPVLTYHLDQPREKTSWRSYGGLRTREDVDQEIHRLGEELKALRAKAEFPAEFLPLSTVNSSAEATALAGIDCDAFLVFAASGAQPWLETLAATRKPNVLFVRHKSGPVYLWYEIAHWRLLRKSEDVKAEPNLDFDDVVVDDYGDVLWRLRGLYGLKNTRGTKVLAIGGLAAYSKPGQERGPGHAQEAWGFDIQTVPHEDVAKRLQQARANRGVMQEVARRTDALLALPNVKLQTDRRFVANTFLALKVFQDLMAETGATNVGVAQCMGGLIPILDTPPCLLLSLINDEGLTGFCHTDMTHTMPGVLLRWISGKPSFFTSGNTATLVGANRGCSLITTRVASSPLASGTASS